MKGLCIFSKLTFFSPPFSLLYLANKCPLPARHCPEKLSEGGYNLEVGYLPESPCSEACLGSPSYPRSLLNQGCLVVSDSTGSVQGTNTAEASLACLWTICVSKEVAFSVSAWSLICHAQVKQIGTHCCSWDESVLLTEEEIVMLA